MSTRRCEWPGCAKPHNARGLCAAHGVRQRLGQDMDAPWRVAVPAHLRVLRRTVPDGECWVWTGSKTPEGYGLVGLGGKHPMKTGPTHRVVYQALVGPIPDGLALDHLCNNRACVNPAHLEPVTVAENNRRAAQRRTMCPKGHPREATYKRRCRLCVVEKSREFRRRKKERAA